MAPETSADSATQTAVSLQDRAGIPWPLQHQCQHNTTCGGGGLCWRGGGLRKYVFLCAACGGLSSLLGVLFLAVYFLLRSYTSSLVYFETVPTYVPASMLLSTGLVVMCLARRRNRYSFLMKLCGCACLASAALCVLVTVATTVVHMSRLQSLSQCHYQQRTQTCTCYSAIGELNAASGADNTEEGARYVFNAITDCDVIHGALYSCLRAMFGLSVVGILVCIFSGMLVYQLFSHEKKKMYWEQLELRCRYLYRRQQSQPPAGHPGQLAAPHHCGSCSCCDDCRDLHTPPPAIPWEFMDSRYWTPGRVGNLYSPNPEDHHPLPAPRGGPGPASSGGSTGSAWSWRRLPWGRSGGGTVGGGASRGASDALCIRPQNASSPDSQYGFNAPGLSQHLGSHLGRDPSVGPYLLSQVYPAPQPHARPFAPHGPTDGMGLPLPLGVPMPLSLADELGPQFYMWGPPPPYMSNPASAANSPARRDPTVNNCPSPANPYPLLVRGNPLSSTGGSGGGGGGAAHRCMIPGQPIPAPALDREDLGNHSAVDSLSSPEKTVPRKKRKKTENTEPSSAEVEAAHQAHHPSTPDPTTPTSVPAARKTKKRSDAPAPPGLRHGARYHRARTAQRPPSADSCCAERSPCCSRAGDVSDDVDTEGYSYPRLKFPPPQAAGAALGCPSATPPTTATDSQAILAAFDNQAFQEGVSDCAGVAGLAALAGSPGPVKTVTLGPQGPLVCKKRPADPNESEVYFGDDSSCCNVSEQHSSLTYEEPGQQPGQQQPGRELRAFKLVHSHLQQRSMDGALPRPVSVHRPSASTLSDSAASCGPESHYHLRQRIPLPLPPPHPAASLAPDAQYESIAESNVYTYISPLPLVAPGAPSPSLSPAGPPHSRRSLKAVCDSPHKAVECADEKENAVNCQRDRDATEAVPPAAAACSTCSARSPDERPGIDV